MKTNLPAPPFSELRNFIVAIFRKWTLLLFMFIATIALVVQLIVPEFSLPSIFYLGFVFVGFVWSAFQAYRDLRSAYQALIPVPVEKIPKSELSISFVVGDEYTYSISDPYSGQNLYITKMQKTRGAKCRFDEKGVFYINDTVYYVLPQETLEINIRIENSGDLPFDVSAFRSENNLNLRYLVMFDGEAFINGTKLRFPLHLKRGEFVILQSRSRIFLNKGSSIAEFAADFRSLPKSILHEISFDTTDVAGKRQTYVSKIETSSKPLKDLYVKQWREFCQEEYLVIAGYSLEPDT